MSKPIAWNQGRYYAHDMGPFASQWAGYAFPPDRASGQGLGSNDCACPGEKQAQATAALSGVAGELFSNPTPLKLAVVGLVAYHGYKKKKSPVAAAVWALAAMVSPIITGGYALYEVVEQGGKRGGMTANPVRTWPPYPEGSAEEKKRRRKVSADFKKHMRGARLSKKAADKAELRAIAAGKGWID